MERNIEIRPFLKGDFAGLLVKAGTIKQEDPTNQEWMRQEVEENTGEVKELEARFIHGRRSSFLTISLVALEENKAVGWICGTEEKAKGEDFNQIKVQTLDSFGDPLVSTRLVSGILEYARDREAGPVYFSLNDPERIDEAVLIKAGLKLVSEVRHKEYRMDLDPNLIERRQPKDHQEDS